MVYRILRAIARIALRWFYRDIEVVGAAHIPGRGPAFLAGNHPNALVDALVIGCTVPSPVTLTAKATLLDHPISRLVVRSVGIIPLRRASDEATRGHESASIDPARNTSAFGAVLDRLAHGGIVLLFPEGKSHSDPALAPLKTGLARMALMARDTRGLGTVPIVPIGLTFERKWEPRTRVVVHVGEAIVPDTLPAGGQDEVEVLTQRVQDGLRAVTLNFRSHGEAEAILGVSETLARVLDQVTDDVRPLGAPDPPLAEMIGVARRVEMASQRLPHVDAVTADRARRFVARLRAFEEASRRRGIVANDVTLDTGTKAGARFVLRESILGLLGGPLALWGRVNHWVPLRLARWLAARVSRNPDEPAMHTIVGGFALVLAFYLIQTGVVWWVTGWVFALAYLLTLPASATWDIAYTDRRRRAVKRIRTYLCFRRTPALQREMLNELAQLRGEAARLEQAASDSAPPATPDYAPADPTTGVPGTSLSGGR